MANNTIHRLVITLLCFFSVSLFVSLCFVSFSVFASRAIPDDCTLPLFGATRHFSNSTTTVHTATADFNNDGNVDIAATAHDARFVGIFIGDGNGNFVRQTVLSAGSFSVPSAVGDFNEDGKQDLAVGSSDGTVWIYLGNGNGTFQAPVRYADGPGEAYQIAVADFNHDSNLDLAIGHQFAGLVIMLGNGNGGFSNSNTYLSGLGPVRVVTADFNNDHNADLLTANAQAGSASLLLGNGSGGFTVNNSPAPSMETHLATSGFAVGDFDEDGKLDFATRGNGSTMVVFYGDGQGAFPSSRSFAAATTSDPHAADFDGDGNLDIVATGHPSPIASVILGDGVGGFGPAITFPVGDGPQGSSVADFNNDGRQDVVTPNYWGGDITVSLNNGRDTQDISAPAINSAPDIFIYANTPGGASVAYSIVAFDNSGQPPTFDCTIPSNSFFNIGTTPVMCAAVDGCGNRSAPVNFNVSVTCGPVDLSPLGDIEVNATSPAGAVIKYAGVGDVASVSFSIPSGSTFPIGTTNVNYIVTELCGNTIPGSFQVRVVDSAPALTIPGSFSSFATSQSGKVVSYSATAVDAVSGVLPVMCAPPSGTLFPMGQTTVTCQVADSAGNTTTGSFNVTIVNCIGCITPTFEFRNHEPIAPVLTRIASADFNRDGKFDIAVTSHDYSFVSVLLSDGSGGFSAPTTLPAGGFSVPVETGDFNRDGNPDMAVGSWDGYVWIYIGDGNGGFADAVQFPDTNNGGEAYQIYVNDFNRDGNPDLAIAHQFSGLSILLGNGTGQFAAPVDYIVGSGPVEVVGADLNNDGNIDLVTSNAQGGDTSILLGDGLGGFAVSSLASATGAIALADFNNDTKIDLVHKSADDNGISLRLGDGGGGFGAPASFPTGGSINRPRAADFNGDGKLDLAVPLGGADKIVVLVGDGSGNFSAPLAFSAGSGPADIAVANLNNDGKPDIACANFFSGNLSVLVNSTYQTPLGSGSVVVVNNTTLTFENVTAGGTTTIAPIDPATVGQVPGGFAVSDSVAYEIETTATFTGSVTLAFKVPGPISEEDFNNLAILHNENGTLEDVTASTPARDYPNLTIYATTTSFSPFYLARRGAHIKTLFDQTKAYKSGSTIPIKLQLMNAVNTNVSSVNTSLVTRDLKLMSGNTTAPVVDSGNANPDYMFRYDPSLGGSGGGYIFNLSTKGLAAGQYVLSFYVGNDHSFFYTVKFEVK